MFNGEKVIHGQVYQTGYLNLREVDDKTPTDNGVQKQNNNISYALRFHNSSQSSAEFIEKQSYTHSFAKAKPRPPLLSLTSSSSSDRFVAKLEVMIRIWHFLDTIPDD